MALLVVFLTAKINAGDVNLVLNPVKVSTSVQQLMLNSTA
jgi:hypothetical protein